MTLRIITSLLVQLLVPIVSCSLVFAQQESPPDQAVPMQEEMAPDQSTQAAQEPPQRHSAIPPPPSEPRQTRPAFSQQELDQMLAPIALYPDSLLSQILMAATYPLEVIEAARWSKANPNLKGEQAVQAVAQNAWDPSVKSLVAFPQILAMMDEKLNWMERLGDAFLTQEQQVMDTVQNLRQKASAVGNLSSNDQIRVEQQGQSIAIQPANPQVVYVPYYNPMVMYGPWWWPAYPPVYWGPWPGYFYGPRFGFGFAWGVGIGVGPGFFFGGFNWPYRHVTVINNFYNRTVNINHGGVWAHDPMHRRGVPYRDLALRQQFGRMSASSEAHREFRGHDSSSFGGRSNFSSRSDLRGGSTSRFNGTGGSRSEMHSAPSRPSGAESPRMDLGLTPSRGSDTERPNGILAHGGMRVRRDLHRLPADFEAAAVEEPINLPVGFMVGAGAAEAIIASVPAMHREQVKRNGSEAGGGG